MFGREQVESTYTLAAPAAGVSASAEPPVWFRERFVVDAAHPWLQFLGSVEADVLRRFGPIAIYGPPGSGKSLLASIVAQRIAGDSRSTDGVCKSLRLKEFDRRVRHAFVVDDAADLIANWENPEVLVWEDAHEASGSPAVDRVLCDLLERRSDCGRLTIVCSRLAPWDSPNLSPRLASRLTAGWVIKLEPPSPPLLEEVLNAFLNHTGVQIQSPVRNWLLSTPRLTVPALFRWLQLTRAAASQHTELTKRDFLATADRAIDAPTVECSHAMRIIARELSVDLNKLVSPSRRQSLVRARGIAIVVLRDLFQLTWQEIAAWAGRKDHSTVIHAYQKTTRALALDRELELDLARVVRQIYKQQPLPDEAKPAAAKRRPRPTAARRPSPQISSPQISSTRRSQP